MIRKSTSKQHIARRLEAKLLRKRAELQQELADYLDTLRQSPSDHLSESGDQAVDTLGDQEVAGIAEMRSLEIERIEQALQRITDKNFGICQRCGQRISVARLIALPATPYCTRCQRELEAQARYAPPPPENWEDVTEPSN